MKKICCFAGHSELYDTEGIYKSLLSVLEDLIITHGINEFHVGNYGAFDKLCAGAVRALKEKYPDVRLYLVIPYITTRINRDKDFYKSNYDGILVADIPQNTPKKMQILKCNMYMVKNSDILVCCVKHSFGGAAKTLEYARRRKNIEIINLCAQCI
ncbi:MAG: hypothetical protein IKV97_05500 [Clostridia bacterium]|nr:hypothetical protein [Clostridia bacterium]